jgi:hypothetical protein
MAEIQIPTPFTRAEVLACIEREIALRERAYPRWIEAGRMTTEKAAKELGLMRAVFAIVRQLPAEQASLFVGPR